jgi:prepilin-type N-terminal cleavage/methylation domain-containing protein
MKRTLRMNKSKRAEAGFSLLEVLIVIAVMAIVAAMAIPTWQRMQKNARLNGDAHNLAESLSVAKMRAGAAFTYSRVFLFTGTDKAQYFRVDTWNTTANSGNGCWVPDGITNPGTTSAYCITTSATTGYETNLSTGVSAGFGSIGTVPSNFVTSVAQAAGCWGGGTTALNGSQISDTSCIVFNSRGFPTASGGFYLTDGTRVYGIVTNTMGLMHGYVTPVSTASWATY